MKLTKTWLSYIIWGIFSIIFFADIGIAAIEIYQKNDMQDFLIPVVSMYAYAFLGILVIIVAYKLYEKFLLKKLKTDGEPMVLAGPLEAFILVMVIFVAVSARVIAIISATNGMEGTRIYYEYATSAIQTYSLDTYSNGAYLFGNVLSFILSFLGHMERAAMGVQTAIQTLTLIALYFMVKKALGRLEAWFGLVLMAFLPGSFFSVRSCTPDSLFTLFFVLFMLGLVYLCAANKEQKIKVNAHGIFYILLGVAAAVLAYYDVAGLIAVIIAVVALAQCKNEDAWLHIQRSWLQILIFMLSFVFAFVLLLWFLPLNGLEVGPASIIGYFTGSISEFSFNIMILSPHKGQWDSLALFILAGLWFVGFLRDRSDKAFPYAIVVVILTLLSFFNIGGFEHASLVSYAWIMLATVGITSIGVFRRTERDIAVAEKTKNDNMARKAEKERKRAEAAGEKSIRLDEVHKKVSVKEPEFDSSSPMTKPRTPDYNSDRIMPDTASGARKGYGIGRRVEEPVVEEPKTVEIVKHPTVENAVSTSVVKEVNDRPAPTTPVNDMSVRTVVRTVDKPPVPEAPTPIPVESKPAYSQGSRSRRALRHPSKSTFTAEQLEGIRSYTGMNIGTAQSVAQVAEPVVQNTEPVVQTIINAEPVKDTVVTGYTELTDVAAVVEEPVVAEPVKTQPIVNEVPAPEVIKESEEETVAEEKVTQETPATVVSQPTTSYVSLSRRHFRHPSKSTFTPEELERISQYTGVQYKTPSETNKDVQPVVVTPSASVEVVPVIQSSVTEAKENMSVSKTPETVPVAEKTIGGSRVIGSRPMPAKLDDIKSQPDRKPKLIRNPLPGPKPHVAKELSYDYVPKESEMKFDIEDLKGRDYFDL